MTLMWTLTRTRAERAERSGKCKVESGHGGTPPCVTESVWIRLKAEGLRRHGRVELCRACRVRESGEWREAEHRWISVGQRRHREGSPRGRDCRAGGFGSCYMVA